MPKISDSVEGARIAAKNHSGSFELQEFTKNLEVDPAKIEEESLDEKRAEIIA